MPSTHVILPLRNLVYIRQHGVVTFDEARMGFQTWCTDPLFSPGQNWLMDCSGAREFDTDPLMMMTFQAQTLPALIQATDPALIVLFAPHPGAGRDIAMGVLRTWDGLGRRLPRLCETEQAALEILGQPERSFAALLANARAPQPIPRNGGDRTA